MTSAFLLCVSFEKMGFCEGFGAYLYSRRLTPCGRGLMAPPGLTALGAKGSACDRLRLTGGLRALALGSYIVSLRWRGTAPSAPFLYRLWRRKLHNRPAGVGNAFPLWWLAPPPCPVGSVSLDSQSPTAPCESSSLATTSWWDYGCLAMEPCLCMKA